MYKVHTFMFGLSWIMILIKTQGINAEKLMVLFWGKLLLTCMKVIQVEKLCFNGVKIRIKGYFFYKCQKLDIFVAFAWRWIKCIKCMHG